MSGDKPSYLDGVSSATTNDKPAYASQATNQQQDDKPGYADVAVSQSGQSTNNQPSYAAGAVQSSAQTMGQATSSGSNAAQPPSDTSSNPGYANIATGTQEQPSDPIPEENVHTEKPIEDSEEQKVVQESKKPFLVLYRILIHSW